MTEELSIKLIIAGRTYPLTINRSEEEMIRRVAKEINESIKVLQDNYAVKDTQDLLAMAALQIATQSRLTSTNSATTENDEEIISELSKIKSSISEFLNN